MSKLLPFETAEQREIRALRAEINGLREELQSLSENFTDLMGQLYHTMEVLGVD